MNDIIKVFFYSVLLMDSGLCQEELTLSKAYDLALSYTPKVQAQRYKTDATAEGIEQAKSRLYPKIDLTGSGGQYEYETYYNGANTSEMYKTYSLSLVQPLYRPEILDFIDQSQVKYNSSQEELSQQEQQLALDVSKAYFKILQILLEIHKLEIQKNFYNAKYEKVISMLPLGYSNTLDLLDAKANKDKSNVDYVSKQQELYTAKIKLEHFIGKSFENFAIHDKMPIIDPFKSISKTLWQQRLLNNNKDNKIASYAKESAKLEINIRQYEHYPKIDLILGNTQNDTKDPVAHKYDNKAFVQISIPLYQGGYTKSRVQEATLLYQAASANLDAVKTQILDQFEDLWIQRKALLETFTVLQEAEQSAHMFFLAIKKSEHEGTKSYVDVLEAQTKYENMKSETMISYYEIILNEIALLTLSGDLTFSKLQSLETIF